MSTVNWEPRDEQEFVATLGSEARIAFEEQVAQYEAGKECDLTGMTQEPMSRADAVQWVIRDWESWDRTMESITPSLKGNPAFIAAGKNHSPAGIFFLDFEKDE